MRTFHGANSDNRQPTLDASSSILGARQLQWLKSSLKASTATWKIVAADLPLGLVVGDGPGRYEAVANGDPGLPLGRELELADLLRDLKRNRVCDVSGFGHGRPLLRGTNTHPTRDVHGVRIRSRSSSRARAERCDAFGPNELIRRSARDSGRHEPPNRPPGEVHALARCGRAQTRAPTV